MTATAFDAHLQTQTALYDDALSRAGFDAAVIYAGRPAGVFLDDTTYPFKVNALFKAWLPVTDAPDSFVVYAIGQRPQLVYCQPEDFWHAAPRDPKGDWTHGFEIHIVRNADEARALMPGGHVAFLGEAPEDVAAWDFDAVNPGPLLNALHFARAWKTPYELDCLTQATRIGVTGHLAARDAFFAGASEYEIHMAYCAATQLTEDTLPYNNIIALNEHTAVLHYTHHDLHAPDDARSFLIDAGGNFHGYASDITRTYSREKNAFRSLIEAVDQVQRALCDSISPGLDYVQLHERATSDLAGALADADIITVSADNAVGSGLATRFFPHGLGHYLGLQVHDVGGFMRDGEDSHVAPPKAYPSLRLTRKVETSQVMTVEPGLYFIPQLLEPLRDQPLGRGINWALVEEFYPFGGIRIEDNVVVTDQGSKNLTREAFDAAA